MIVFNHEIYIDGFNRWKFKDEEGDIFLSFDLFNFWVYSTGFGIIFLNFGLTIYWY